MKKIWKIVENYSNGKKYKKLQKIMKNYQKLRKIIKNGENYENCGNL